MKMTLGISNGKMWSIILLLAIIFISLILSHMPFLVKNHYAYEGMSDVSGGKPDVGADTGAHAGAHASPSVDPSAIAETHDDADAAEEPSMMDKIKSWFGIGASGTASAGANIGASGVGASANTMGSANIGPLKGTVGGSLNAGIAVDGSGNTTGSASTSTDGVMPATPAMLKGKQENFEALKEDSNKKVGHK
jgi:hypothetical protein